MAMHGPELRTYALGAVVSVLLGAGTGFGWHYFADSAGRRVAAAPAAPLAQQDAPNYPSSNPPAPGAVLDVRRLPDLSNAQQRAHSHQRCTKGNACGKHQPDRLVASSAPA